MNLNDKTTEYKPSWLRWPPNCCETCTGWKQSSENQWIGICHQSSLEPGITTDSRYRCFDFVRKPDKQNG